jgi:pSer/pThr/pTyr-binding forkhead associated (FHA) protein
MATSKLQLSFRIFKNGQLVRETQLSQGVIKIGKVASAHLHLEDEHVSRMHAIIEVLGEEVSVIDLGSTVRPAAS